MFYIFHEQLINHDWSEKDSKASSEIIQKYEEGFYKTDAELNHLLLCIFIIIKKRSKYLSDQDINTLINIVFSQTNNETLLFYSLWTIVKLIDVEPKFNKQVYEYFKTYNLTNKLLNQI